MYRRTKPSAIFLGMLRKRWPAFPESAGQRGVPLNKSTSGEKFNADAARIQELRDFIDYARDTGKNRAIHV
jgi:hypothetical protein